VKPDHRSMLRYYLTIIRRRRLVVLLGFVIPVAVAVGLTVHAKKMYQGSASVVISRQSLADQVTATPDPTASAPDFLNVVQTYADSARSTQVADRVVNAVKSAHLTATELLSDSTVSASQDSDILGFNVQSRDPALAQQLSTAYANQFVSYQQQQTNASIVAALAQIDSRLRQAKRTGPASLVGTLTSRDQQLRTLEALQTNNNFVFNPSTTTTQVSPRTKVNVALGVIGGLVLATLLAALLETLDTRVRTSEEVEEILGVPLLARIGPPPKGFDKRVLTLVDPTNIHAEGYRILRTNLELQALRDHAKVFMVSGSVEEEGKSVTIANVAVAAARSGHKTILVDLDLRQPTQDALFGCNGRVPGVTNILLGRATLDEALVEIPLQDGKSAGEGSLRLLRSGILPPDPGELVASEQLETLIGQLRTEADVVYIDCPPILRAGDAMTISRLCDVVFLVARIPQVRRPMLTELARAIATCPVPVAGFVATGKQTNEPAYRYGYARGRYGHPAPRDQAPAAAPTPVPAAVAVPATVAVHEPAVANAEDEPVVDELQREDEPAVDEAPRQDETADDEAPQEDSARSESPDNADGPEEHDQHQEDGGGAETTQPSQPSVSAGPDRAPVAEFFRARWSRRD
jgi:polysaccharide biosynthesis transport protein